MLKLLILPMRQHPLRQCVPPPRPNVKSWGSLYTGIFILSFVCFFIQPMPEIPHSQPEPRPVSFSAPTHMPHQLTHGRAQSVGPEGSRRISSDGHRLQGMSYRMEGVGHAPPCKSHCVWSMKSIVCNSYKLTRWRLVPSVLGLESMGNACYSNIKSSSTG